MLDSHSGVRHLHLDDSHGELPVTFGGQIVDFDPKRYVKPRKSLKVMCRDIQLGFSAAAVAIDEAGVVGSVDPERFGVVYGAVAGYVALRPVTAGGSRVGVSTLQRKRRV